jgi:hypothetical protein
MEGNWTERSTEGNCTWAKRDWLSEGLLCAGAVEVDCNTAAKCAPATDSSTSDVRRMTAAFILLSNAPVVGCNTRGYCTSDAARVVAESLQLAA